MTPVVSKLAVAMQKGATMAGKDFRFCAYYVLITRIARNLEGVIIYLQFLSLVAVLQNR